MPMKHPPHLGHSIGDACLKTMGLSVTEGARILSVARHTLSRLIHGHAILGDWHLTCCSCEICSQVVNISDGGPSHRRPGKGAFSFLADRVSIRLCQRSSRGNKSALTL